jgi:glutathione S-transferase
MTLKLYYAPNTRAGRPRWLLEELEVPYELVRLDPAARENRRPEYLALNPTGHVPTLVDGDQPIFESLAICLYLADKFPEKGLAPAPSDPGRGAYLQWAVYSMVSLEREVDTLTSHTVALPQDQRVAAVADTARKNLLDAAAHVEAALEGKEYLAGDRFSAADVMTSSVLGWAKLIGVLADRPRLLEYVRRCVSRPAARRSRTD